MSSLLYFVGLMALSVGIAVLANSHAWGLISEGIGLILYSMVVSIDRAAREADKKTANPPPPSFSRVLRPPGSIEQ